MNTQDAIRLRFLAVKDLLDERSLRLFVASEAQAFGYGGIIAASKATGFARSTIGRGLKDLDQPALPKGDIRRKGSGPPRLIDKDATLMEDLQKLVEPAIVGDPMRPLLWVSKSWAKLAAALQDMGHKISVNSISSLLGQLGYRRLSNLKNKESNDHPDRDAQFEYINVLATAFQAASQPVVSIDTKKKENVGNFKNNGTDYRPKGSPDEVNDHDFMDETLGKAIPHGIYDTSANEGWVTVGINNDTSEFAVNSLRYWWKNMGEARYPNADSLLITADGGGSNGSRVHLWKRELQTFTNETGISVTVCHYPPGTSKWNKIEHRLFCHITQNWRGKPLSSLMAIVELIAATTTSTGLKVRCEIDERVYAKGIKVSDDEFERINITKHDFCSNWNYTIRPQIGLIATEEVVIIV